MQKLAAWSFVALFAAYSLAHFGRSAVYLPFVHHGMVQNEMEMRPLRDHFLGKPARLGNHRQYGPAFLFVLHPFLAWMAGPDPAHIEFAKIDEHVVRLSRSLLVFELACTVLACWFVIASLRLWKAPPWAAGAVVLLWLNFTPLYEVIDVKTVEPWELCLMAGAMYAYLRGNSAWAGVCIAAAALMKWLPGFLLLLLLLRDRRALVWSAIGALGILLAAHLVYGPEMGLLYPLLPLRAGSGETVGFLGHASFSFKSLIGKAIGEFRPVGEVIANPPAADYVAGYDIYLTPAQVTIANVLGNLCTLLVVAWTAVTLWRRSSSGDAIYDKLWDWSLVTAVMFVIPPVTSYEYGTLLLPAYSAALAFLFVRPPGVRRNVAGALLAASILLVPNVVPRTLVMRAVLVGPFFHWAGPAHFTLDQKYYSFGYPLFGGLFLIGALWSMRPQAR